MSIGSSNNNYLSSINNNNSNSSSMGIMNQFGDTSLTKVFVGGLAWETPKEALRDHFHKYGDILEAVIISDKLSGRSKGYGFVTFKDAEAAKKACEDPTPVINGRRANCNLASLGARRSRPPPTSAPPAPHPHPHPHPGSNVGVGRRSASPAPANHVQWYYAAAGTPPSPYHHHQPHHAVPFYGYSPTYVATDMNYNHGAQKLGYTTGGSYMNGGHYSAVYPGTGQAMMGANALMPMYPLYHFHHQAQAMGLPAHIFPPSTAGPMAAAPPLISKPASMAAPTTGTVCLAVE
ncbi:probable RNA-binding protein ARP1 [Malania oleifera]|uniref:probable RNA-binding protein ARP1 n=1 Tax=Malania oleifera TaxID=397392 RepID=UPI0025AE2755|nr:probable RNA-binding protein ARP1 [Malania oleifera]